MKTDLIELRIRELKKDIDGNEKEKKRQMEYHDDAIARFRKELKELEKELEDYKQFRNAKKRGKQNEDGR